MTNSSVRFGFFNQLLEIDQTSENNRYQILSDNVLWNTLGGKGLGTWFLLQYNLIVINPISPENWLIVTTGPATDTKFWEGQEYGKKKRRRTRS